VKWWFQPKGCVHKRATRTRREMSRGRAAASARRTIGSVVAPTGAQQLAARDGGEAHKPEGCAQEARCNNCEDQLKRGPFGPIRHVGQGHTTSAERGQTHVSSDVSCPPSPDFWPLGGDGARRAARALPILMLASPVFMEWSVPERDARVCGATRHKRTISVRLLAPNVGVRRQRAECVSHVAAARTPARQVFAHPNFGWS